RYLSAIRENCSRALLDLHNIESAWHQSVAVTENWAEAAALRWFGARSRGLEKEWLPQFDAVLAPSEADARLARSLAPGARVSVYPNALPELARPVRVEENVIAFSGNLEYRPNQDAVRFFAREIWPGLRAEWPAMRWRIIGKNPQGVSTEVRGDPRIELTGPVKDAVTELAKAKVAVVPLRAGSGTRIKILEAWAAGTAVVSTTIGAEGLDAASGEQFLLADDPAEFRESVSALFASHQKRQRLGEAGRLRYQEQYSWTACEGLLDKVVSELSCGKSVN
ncbi:MAG: glycosyltransferase family 4 protein, partial [Bryobacteraceae bacterium]